MIAHGKAEERRIVHDMVEIIMDTEIAGAGHDALLGEGGAEEV